jgi:uncharacterized SAM-binding protein YcdF (DUF218 family)
VIVLGCRVVFDGARRLAPGALRRRVEKGAELYRARAERAGAETIVVVSGGRHWGEIVEADAMAAELARLGVPIGAVVRERCSLSTRDNARFTAETLRRRGISRASVVTCAWHLPRALTLFVREGIEAEGIAAREGQPVRLRSRLWRWGVERVLTQV